MKNIKQIITSILIVASISINAQVAINTDGSDADASAILDVKSTEKGLMPPRMTEAQMNTISNPGFGLMVMCSDCNPKGPYYFDGSNWVNFSTNFMSFSDMINPTTGETWMDRNLGASRVAQSSTDYEAYGSLYQWGRGSDGHEVINWTSSTGSDGAEQANETSTLSNSNTPGHGDFIINNSYPIDWRSPQNDDLWQGVNGINNPCPSGYRLPTSAEWEAERVSWSSNNAAGAIGSPLKLPVAGRRYNSFGALSYVGSSGFYWSSTAAGSYAISLYFLSGDANVNSEYRARGFSVRCLKD